MQINARTFQILSAVRQASLQLLTSDDGAAMTLPTPTDLHKVIMDKRDRDRRRYGKAYMAPSAVEEAVTRLVDADLLSWDGNGLVLLPKASVMVDVLDGGGVDAFEDNFFENYKEQVARAALAYLYGMNPEPTMNALCEVVAMSDHSLRRGLMSLKDKKEITVDTSSRLHTYSLTVAPPIEEEEVDEDASAEDILGLSDDGPITVQDLNAAASLVGDQDGWEAPVVAPEVKEAPVAVQAAPSVPLDVIPASLEADDDEVAEDIQEAGDGLEHLQANLDWIRVPQAIQTSFAVRAKAMGLSLTVYLDRLDKMQARKLRDVLLND
jgi:hypothetical protein